MAGKTRYSLEKKSPRDEVTMWLKVEGPAIIRSAGLLRCFRATDVGSGPIGKIPQDKVHWPCIWIKINAGSTYLIDAPEDMQVEVEDL